MGNRFKYFDEMCEEMSPYEDCLGCSTQTCEFTTVEPCAKEVQKEEQAMKIAITIGLVTGILALLF